MEKHRPNNNKKKKNKMSSDMRSVPDLNIIIIIYVANSDKWAVKANSIEFDKYN